MDWTTIYWVTRLDGLNGYCSGLASVFIVAAVVCLLAAGAMSMEMCDFDKGGDHPLRKARRLALWLIPPTLGIGMLFLLIGVMLPTTKEACAMYIIPKVVNSEIVADDLPTDAREIYDLATDYVKEQLKPAGKGGK